MILVIYVKSDAFDNIFGQNVQSSEYSWNYITEKYKNWFHIRFEVP